MTLTRAAGSAAACALLLLLILPVLGLLIGASPGEFLRSLQRPETRLALALSLRTSMMSLGLAVLLGTPLAWWLSRSEGGMRSLVGSLVELPVVLPPAVLGVALLETFGRQGLLGASLWGLGVQIPFTSMAVVLAQVLVGAPLYVLAATTAFRAVDGELLLLARTLGAGPSRAWWTVAMPAAAPGLVTGMALAWARALGEFGATLLFAGSFPGTTRTLPLVIYGSMERDMAEARAISMLLLGVAVCVLLGVRLLRRGAPGAD